MRSIITITPAAADYVNTVLAANPGHSLLVGYDNRGCSGHKYTFGFVAADAVTQGDETVQLALGQLVIRAEHVLGLLGSTLDLAVTEFSSQLVWNNPMATDSCGCGESFKLGTAKPCDQ